MSFIFWRRRRDLNPRYPFGVYTISNRARSASYATSPCLVGSLADSDMILHEAKFVKQNFYFFRKSFRRPTLPRMSLRSHINRSYKRQRIQAPR